MRILEILLPKSLDDHSISPKHIQRIDTLQKRMDAYVDKICDPKTSAQGKEFLKSRLRDDYHELKDTIAHVHKIAEDGLPPVEPIKPIESFEVVDSRTGKVMGKPYNSRSRARSRADKLDNEYGAYRYKVRRVGSSFMIEATLSEAVHKLPLTSEDFDLVQKLMSRPIPAAVAPIYIQEIIDDDEFNSMLNEFAEINPNMDVRPHVVEWIKRVMPDQMYRFDDSAQTLKQRLGQTSVIHGYDPNQYHSSSESMTGNAYGRR
jgi:hypothetical protein